MPINSCSINAFTINALACRRRNFPIPGPVTTGGGSVQHYRYQNWYGRPEEEIEDQQFASIEQDTILLTLTINGQTIEKSFDNSFTDIMPIISVNNINIEGSSTKVELYNLKLEKL